MDLFEYGVHCTAVILLASAALASIHEHEVLSSMLTKGIRADDGQSHAW